MIVPGMFVCSSFLISVCMFIVSKTLLISSATVIVRAGVGHLVECLCYGVILFLGEDVLKSILFVFLSLSLHLMTLVGKFAGFTECMKQFLYFKRLSAGICPCKDWASFVSCLSFSTLAHASHLMLAQFQTTSTTPLH